MAVLPDTGKFTVVDVGMDKQPAAWMAELLMQRDRTLAAPTFDPAGLYFAGVEYDAVWRLPQGAPESAMPGI